MDMVCHRNMSVDTLHKGETEDNNNNNNKFTGHHCSSKCDISSKEKVRTKCNIFAHFTLKRLNLNDSKFITSKMTKYVGV
jgi:hypothetical protein